MTSFLLQAFLTLFVVIDPIGLIPIFITLAGTHPSEEQSHIARRAVLIAGGILLVFTLSGNFLLHYLGISIEAFQIAGGILLLKIAIDMVFVHRERETEEEEKEAQSREDVSVFPLAIPLIAGPGTLASVVILVNDAKLYPLGLLMILGITALVLAIAFVIFYLSQYVSKFLGQTGINVISRVLGVLLSALAVQYVADGAIVLLRTVFDA